MAVCHGYFENGFHFFIYRTTDAAFSSLMQNMEIIPVFGTSFTTYVPIIMIIIALITLFDGFARILKLLGVETEDVVSPANGFCGFFKRQEDEMDAELLEKCKNGKMIIANELRQVAIAHEALKKNRAAFESRRDQSEAEVQVANLSSKSKFPQSSSNSASSTNESRQGAGFLSNWKETITKVGVNAARYSNLEATKPRSILEDEDEDEESIYFDGGSSKYSKSSFAKREEDFGESIYTSTLSANFSSIPNKFVAGQTTTHGVAAFMTQKPSPHVNSTSVGSNQHREPSSKVLSKSFFDFDDDESSNGNYRGRYSDV